LAGLEAATSHFCLPAGAHVVFDAAFNVNCSNNKQKVNVSQAKVAIRGFGLLSQLPVPCKNEHQPH
jgi:hypothetical protein